MSTAKRRKLSWFGHVGRHDTIQKTIQHGTVENGHRSGRPRKSWKDGKTSSRNGQAHHSSMLRIAYDRSRWTTNTTEASIWVLQRRLGVTGIEIPAGMLVCTTGDSFNGHKQVFLPPSFIDDLNY